MDEVTRGLAGKELHLKEYESLRKEISELVEHSRKLEIYAVGGITAYYAWFLTAGKQPTAIALGIPTVLAILAALRSLATLVRIEDIAGYILTIESALALRDPLIAGWETSRSKKKAESTKKWGKAAPFVTTATLFWVSLIVVTIVAWGLPWVV